MQTSTGNGRALRPQRVQGRPRARSVRGYITADARPGVENVRVKRIDGDGVDEKRRREALARIHPGLSAVDALEHAPVCRGTRVNGRGLLRVDSEGADAALGGSEGDGGAMELMAAIRALADTVSGSRVDDLAVRGVDRDRERLQRSGRRVQRAQGLPGSAGIGAQDQLRPAVCTLKSIAKRKVERERRTHDVNVSGGIYRGGVDAIIARTSESEVRAYSLGESRRDG